MIPDNVTLIVKAPNQQIEDQNIECQSSWTVLELKGHLSEVYPSKPTTDEQKIIYSGQLLENNTVLKDVLRTYDSQIVHTMHLVCTPKRRQPTTKETPIINQDGIRHRNVPEASNATPQTAQTENITRPETRQNDQNHTVEMQNYLSSFVNNYGRVPPYPNYGLAEGYLPVQNDPVSMANHVAMMQQAYLQYMQQYANMWQAGNPPPAEATPPPAPEAPPAQPEDEEGMAARDWLDHVYSASRLAILVSLVYLYGSPARLLLVILIAAAGYLHQIGFFRDLHVNPVNNANARPNARVQPNDNARAQPNDNARVQPNDNARVQANDNAGIQPNDNARVQANDNARVQANDNVQANPNRTPANADATNNVTSTTENQSDANHAPINHDNDQSLLAFTWMIFSSFFASLIPDTN